MRVKVLRPFKDRHTKERYAKGQIITVTEKRFKEINGGPHGALVLLIDEPEKPKAKKTRK